ncbi:MAG: metalloregulator ArsR/SmtB family transcription factor [Thermoplasmata archaeon]|jgi:ArsR family transcriptional regulator|nr:metalloregulator ArsR/SmtB family transcription factor [Thermoplasmata archaeon]
MLTWVDMMSRPKAETVLASRLERLPNADPTCCVPEYAERSRAVVQSSRFRSALHRAQALADERRLTALALLRRAPELCACEIQAALGVTHATVSHHMGVLTEAGWVRAERRGKWMYYRLDPKATMEIP